MKPNEPESPETIEAERDTLLKIVGGAQEREKQSEQVLQLLILAGYVSEDHVKQARNLVAP